VYGNTTNFATGDPDYKICVRIKDFQTGITYWLDKADYEAKIAGCNPVSYASGCGIVTALSAGTPGTTTATIIWTDYPGGAAIEYINNTSSTAPVVDGTLLAFGVGTLSLTGLSAGTTYHFWIRTVCAAGVKGAWTSLVYATHP
jgi:hypothetical protein